jgi:hypothetical protein
MASLAGWLLISAACERTRIPQDRPGTPAAAPLDAAPLDGSPPAELAPASAAVAGPDATAASPTAAGAAPDARATATGGHPGTIVFVDADGSERSQPASEVPDAIAWATVNGTRVPVVRVVRTGTSQRIEIARYGADGQVLERTTGAAPPRRP